MFSYYLLGQSVLLWAGQAGPGCAVLWRTLKMCYDGAGRQLTFTSQPHTVHCIHQHQSLNATLAVGNKNFNIALISPDLFRAVQSCSDLFSTHNFYLKSVSAITNREPLTDCWLFANNQPSNPPTLQMRQLTSSVPVTDANFKLIVLPCFPCTCRVMQSLSMYLSIFLSLR